MDLMSEVLEKSHSKCGGKREDCGTGSDCTFNDSECTDGAHIRYSESMQLEEGYINNIQPRFEQQNERDACLKPRSAYQPSPSPSPSPPPLPLAWRRTYNTPLLAVVLLCLATNSLALRKSHGLEMGRQDFPRRLAAASDGTLYVAGATTSANKDDQDIWVIKYGPDLEAAWQRRFKDSTKSVVRSVVGSPERGCYVAGTTYFSGREDSDGFLMEVGLEGNQLWFLSYGSGENEEVNDVRVIGDEAILAGRRGRRAWALRVNRRTGDILGSEEFGVNSQFNAVEVWDQGSVLAGFELEQGFRKALLVKQSRAGETQWEFRYSGKEDIEISSVSIGRGGQYFVATGKKGGTRSYCAKVSASGVLLWERDYRLAEDGYAIRSLEEGTHLVSGRRMVDGRMYGLILVVSDEDGGREGEKVYETFEEFSDVLVTGKGRFVTLGYSRNNSLALLEDLTPMGSEHCFRDKCYPSPGPNNIPTGDDHIGDNRVFDTRTGHRYQARGTNDDISESAYDGEYTSPYEQPSRRRLEAVLLEPYEQKISQATSPCPPCADNFYCATVQGKCLYKGVFEAIADFNAHAVKASCFGSGKLSKPYNESCRAAYHTLCCQGSALLSNVSCNILLEIDPSNPMYDNYCGACPFMDLSKCPTNGTCFNDTVYISNSQDPYTPGEACNKAIAAYCSRKLELRPNDDPECSYISASCSNSSINSSTKYTTTSYSSFQLGTTVPFLTEGFGTLPIFSITENKTLFNANLVFNITNSTEVEINTEKIYPNPYLFKLAYKGFVSQCGVSFPYESLIEVDVGNRSHKMVDFNLNATIVNPSVCETTRVNIIMANITYNPPKVAYGISYSGPVPKAARSKIRDYSQFTNNTFIDFNPGDMIPGSSISVFVTVSDYIGTKRQKSITIAPSNPGGRAYPCELCQFHDRSFCKFLDGYCWADYKDPNGVVLTSERCLREVAKFCYEVWDTLEKADPQCQYFNSHFDQDLIMLKPTLLSAKYKFIESRLTIVLDFDMDIRISETVACESLLPSSIIDWMSPGGECNWLGNRQLLVRYNTNYGLLKTIQISPNTVFYSYSQAYAPAANPVMTIEVPDLTGTIGIHAPTRAGPCSDLLVQAITESSNAFSYIFQWEAHYSSASSISNQAIVTGLAEHMKSYQTCSTSRKLIIPSNLLVPGQSLSIVLRAEVVEYEDEYIASTNVMILSQSLSVRMSTGNLKMLELRGDETNIIEVSVDWSQCSLSNRSLNVSFEVYSGDTPDTINARAASEIGTESKLKSNFDKHSIVVVSQNSGFSYNRFYSLKMCLKDTLQGVEDCDLKYLKIIKPPIHSIIEGQLLRAPNDTYYLNAINSIIPERDNEFVYRQWTCVECYSLDTKSACECPRFHYEHSVSHVLELKHSEMQANRLYTFGHGLRVGLNYFIRSAFNTTKFIISSNKLSLVPWKVIAGTKDERYLAPAIEYEGADTDLAFKWELLEVKYSTPLGTVNYTNLQNFYLQSVGLASGTTVKIPEEYYPRALNTYESRTLGLHLSDLKPNYRYTFHATITKSAQVWHSLVTLVGGEEPDEREITVLPTSGVALGSTFQIEFASANPAKDQATRYQIYRRNCPSYATETAYAISPMLDSVGSYKLILSEGLESCDYEVGITVKSFIGERYSESSQNVRVLPAGESLRLSLMEETLLRIQNRTLLLTAGQIYSYLLAIVDRVETGKYREQVLKVMDEIDGIGNGNGTENGTGNGTGDLLGELDTPRRIEYCNISMMLIGRIALFFPDGMSFGEANRMMDKIEFCVKAAAEMPEKGKEIVHNGLTALNYLAKKCVRDANQVIFSRIGPSYKKLVSLVYLEADRDIFEFNSDFISVSRRKESLDTFKMKKTLQTQNGVTVYLPMGLDEAVVSYLPNGSDSKKSTLSIITTLSVTSFNPHPLIRANTEISPSFLANYSYNTNVTDAEMVRSIYKDLALGRHEVILDMYWNYVSLMELKFTISAIEKNAAVTDYDKNITIGSLKSEVKADFPFNSTEEERSTFFLIPLFYQHEKGKWTNEGCSLDNVTDTNLRVKCSHMGTIDASTGAAPKSAAAPSVQVQQDSFSLTVDVFKDSLIGIYKSRYKSIFHPETDKKFGLGNIYVVAVVLIPLLILGTIAYILAERDETMLFLERLDALTLLGETRTVNDTRGFIQEVCQFINRLKIEEFQSVALRMSGQIQNFNQTAEDKISTPQMEGGNGFSILSEAEHQAISDLYEVYSLKREKYNMNELFYIFEDVLPENRALERRTQLNLYQKYPLSGVCCILLCEHPVLQAFLVMGIQLTRTTRCLILCLVYAGMAAISGYFYNSSEKGEVEDKIDKIILTAFYSSLIMVPICMMLQLIFSGYELKVHMSRSEIKSLESRRRILGIVGFVLEAMLMIFFIYSIVSFSFDFEEEALKLWMYTICFVLAMEIVVLYLLKLLFKFAVGALLIRLSKCGFMLSTVGLIIGNVLSFLLTFT